MVRVRREPAPSIHPGPVVLDDSRCLLHLLEGGHLELDRQTGTATYFTPSRLDDEELIHPYLAPTGAIFARWHGRQAMHAGAFLIDGTAWGVVGRREGGKSTLLAWLHAAGHPIVADDVLVVEGERCLAGPRAIDLREPAAGRVAGSEELPSVRSATRRRLALPPVAPDAPLGGWVFLEWGERLEIERLSAPERLGYLTPQRMGRRMGEDPEGLLHLAGLPAFRLRRPPGWDGLDETVGRLVGFLSD